MSKQSTVKIGRGRPSHFNYSALPFSVVNDDGTITGEYFTTEKESTVISARDWGRRHGVKIVGKYNQKTGKYQIFKINPEHLKKV